MSLAVQPAAAINGEVAIDIITDRSEEAAVCLVVQAADESDESAESDQAQTLCRPASSGPTTFSVPEGRWNIRLESGDFAPMFWWDVSVNPERKTRLGHAKLTSGASVAGWIMLPDDPGIDVTDCELFLRQRVSAWAGDPKERRKADLAMRAAAPDQQGFFRLAGLPKGPWDLGIRLPEVGEVHLSEIDLEEAEHLLLETPFEIAVPASITVYIDPPVTGDASPWQITILRETKGTTVLQMIDGGATALGGWTSRPLFTGKYEIRVSDANGSQWHTEEIEIDEHMRLFQFRLDLVRVSGIVDLGGTPIAAELAFGGYESRPQILFHSNEDGEFSGDLPHAGEWKLDVRLEDGSIFRAEAVEIEEANEADLTIHLPGTAIRGVVHFNGRPVARALVTIRTQGHTRSRVATMETDDAGEFQFLGVQPEALMASALHGTSTSNWALFHLAEDSSVENLSLEIIERRTIRGRVMQRGQGVAGAELVYFVGPASAPRHPAKLATDIEGGFEVQIPIDESSIDIVLATPDPSIYFLDLAVPHSQSDGAEPLNLRLPDITLPGPVGTLTIPLEYWSEPGEDAVHQSWLQKGSTRLPVLSLISLAHRLDLLGFEENGTFSIRGMGPGDYHVCGGRPGECLLLSSR